MAVELRKVLCQSILKEMRVNDRIVSIGADLDKADGLFPLWEAFPDRAFSAGIAEQNMAGIAAGMASQGMVPVINTFAPYATRRICDQVAVSICYANTNVKIIGTDPGITAELNGGTHMTFEDIGVVRSIPNITILEPADAIELEQMVPAMIRHKGPVYMRLYRKLAPLVHKEDYQYELGKADFMKEGKDISIFCSGIMVCEAMDAASELERMGIDAEVINIHTIKPLDKDAVIRSVRKTGVAITAENHNILGGLRAAIAEAVTEEYPVRIYPIGVKDIKGEVGKLPYLREQFGLTSAVIVKTAEKAVKER
ncbi:MAG TPA: transketolase C-terminal domain-containing protein [Anaerovoracaceae bacterium]|nr:transketolase C-terminal domain-containing protein [Anaerovoracaceae bacterium]